MKLVIDWVKRIFNTAHVKRTEATEASRLRAEAELRLETARAKQRIVEQIYNEQREVSDAFRDEQRRNHFAEMISRIINPPLTETLGDRSD